MKVKLTEAKLRQMIESVVRETLDGQVIKGQIKSARGFAKNNSTNIRSSRNGAKNESRKSMKKLVEEQTRRAITSLLKEEAGYTYNFNTYFDFNAGQVPGLLEFVNQNLGLDISEDIDFRADIQGRGQYIPEETQSMYSPGSDEEMNILGLRITGIDLQIPEEGKSAVIQFLNQYINSENVDEYFSERMNEALIDEIEDDYYRSVEGPDND